jgi:hypothetical protein
MILGHSHRRKKRIFKIYNTCLKVHHIRSVDLKGLPSSQSLLQPMRSNSMLDHIPVVTFVGIFRTPRRQLEKKRENEASFNKVTDIVYLHPF